MARVQFGFMAFVVRALRFVVGWDGWLHVRIIFRQHFRRGWGTEYIHEGLGPFCHMGVAHGLCNPDSEW